jgi:integrase
MTDPALSPAPRHVVVDDVVDLPWLEVGPIPAGMRPRQAWESGLVAPGSLSERGVEWAAAQGPVTTRSTYLSAVRGFCLFVAGGDEDRARGVPLQALTRATLMAYREYLENGDPLADPPVPPRAASTVAKIFSALRGLAAEEDVQLGTLKTRSAPRRLPTPIPEHQYQLALKLIAARIQQTGGTRRTISDAAVRAYRDRAALRLLGDCGLRRGEAIDLQVADIRQRERGEARLRIGGAGGSERNATRWWIHVRAGKRGKERWVPIPADVYEDLKGWMRARSQVYASPHGPLLLAAPTFNGDQAGGWRPLTVRQLYNIVAACTEAAGATGKATRPHALRHRYCTFLARRGVPIETIRELAGHADIRTTQLYLQLSSDQLENAVAGAFEEDVPEFARAALADAA